MGKRSLRIIKTERNQFNSLDNYILLRKKILSHKIRRRLGILPGKKEKGLFDEDLGFIDNIKKLFRIFFNYFRKN